VIPPGLACQAQRDDRREQRDPYRASESFHGSSD
jgi:hypothetical protein